MRLIEFLTELQRRGGKVTDVRICCNRWGGAWVTGVYLSKMNKDCIWASTFDNTGKHGVRLEKGHPAIESYVTNVSLVYLGTLGKRAILRHVTSKPFVHIHLSKDPIAPPQVSE